jgi:formamidopyrimidine-DNA glycosylase
MHFGMAGWLKIKDQHTYYYQPKKGDEKEEWPPKFMKFLLETKPEDGQEVVEAAFVDMRRFARVRLVDCPAEEIRNVTPLKENGPDPVIDKDVVTLKWLTEKCRAKKVPIKAMLLDQANISGIGNWVGDEIMYNAKMHPEQYANTLSDEQIQQLHTSIHYICKTAVDLIADSDKFPEDWLFKHRWGKGKKGVSNTMPSGEKILFLTVGGRTSAVVPSVQKKTGPVAKEMIDATGASDNEKPKKTKGKKRKAETDEDEEEEEVVRPKKTTARTKKTRVKEAKEVTSETGDGEEDVKPGKTNVRSKKAKVNEEEDTKPAVDDDSKQVNGATKLSKTGKEVKTGEIEHRELEPPTKKAAAKRGKAVKTQELTTENTGRRRSGRLSKG